MLVFTRIRGQPRKTIDVQRYVTSAMHDIFQDVLAVMQYILKSLLLVSTVLMYVLPSFLCPCTSTVFRLEMMGLNMACLPVTQRSPLALLKLYVWTSPFLCDEDCLTLTRAWWVEFFSPQGTPTT